MIKKIIFVLLLMVVIFSTSALADNCGGIVQCHCGNMLVESQVMWYDLLNCPGDGLTIGGNHIILNCNNHLIDGDDSGILDAGLFIYAPETTITNCNIQEFHFGIYMNKYSSNNIITYNRVNNNYFGIFLDECSNNNVLLDNIASHNRWIGINLWWANDNVLSNNTINNNKYGIYVFSSYNNNIWSNNLVNNRNNAFDNRGSNNWNVSFVGNYWNDFPSNPGYPNYYIIPGSSNSIDWYPIWNISNFTGVLE